MKGRLVCLEVGMMVFRYYVYCKVNGGLLPICIEMPRLLTGAWRQHTPVQKKKKLEANIYLQQKYNYIF
jgi:hypothetical protein